MGVHLLFDLEVVDGAVYLVNCLSPLLINQSQLSPVLFNISALVQELLERLLQDVEQMSYFATFACCGITLDRLIDLAFLILHLTHLPMRLLRHLRHLFKALLRLTNTVLVFLLRVADEGQPVRPRQRLGDIFWKAVENAIHAGDYSFVVRGAEDLVKTKCIGSLLRKGRRTLRFFGSLLDRCYGLCLLNNWWLLNLAKHRHGLFFRCKSTRIILRF